MRPGYIPSPELLNDAMTEWAIMYDGFNARRTMNFTIPDFIYNVPPNNGTGVSFSGTTVLGSPTITGASTTVGLQVGMTLTGSAVQPNTFIAGIAGSTVNMTNVAAISGTSVFSAAQNGSGSAALATGQILGMGFTIGLPFGFAATLTIGSQTMVVLNRQGLEINQAVSGAGIPNDSRIIAINDIYVTINNVASASGPTTVTVTADFTGPRPEAIVRANLWMSSTSPTAPTRIPLAPVSAEEWANISVLQLTPINVTTVFYYEPRYPNGVIWVWPPLNGNSIEIFTWGSLTPPGALIENYNAPPGYADVLVYELAKRLYGLCDNEMMVSRRNLQLLRADAEIAKRAVRSVNAPQPRLVNDFRPTRSVGTGTSDWELLLAGIPY
jgi:hypothetical protein